VPSAISIASNKRRMQAVVMGTPTIFASRRHKTPWAITGPVTSRKAIAGRIAADDGT
jgi:hypothetical protein